MKYATPFLLMLIAAPTHGATVFEGFYRIERDRRHVGFGVQRLRKDGDQRILTTYYRFKRPDETEVFESYKDVTKADGTPISSEHHGNNDGLPATWARFVGKRGRVDFGAPTSRKPASVTGVGLLSSMLFFSADLPRFAPGTVYKYRAFSEERGRLDTGTLHAVSVTDARGIKVYRLVDDYEGEPIENFVSASGQPLGSRALGGDYVTYWVPTREQAIDVFKYPNQDVIALFGDLPEGKASDWAKLENFDAEKVIRDTPKWKGRRILNLKAMATTKPLPTRSL